MYSMKTDLLKEIYTEWCPVHTGPRSISILKIIQTQGESKIELDEEALKSIFERPEVAKFPVMLLSVSGAFRKGKSFLLNFFLRYLRHKGYSTSDWLGKENVNDGFEWRGGKQPHTQGILIYDEVFFVPVNGERTAVFLMDSQGLFDNNSDKKLCTQIFAFSTLLSSVQVFNLSQQIQENDLEYLQCFTEYAKFCRESKSVTGPPFQKLMFVVRDWQELEDHDYGLDLEKDAEGKKGYLADVMSCVSNSKELLDVRSHLRESFSDLQCFLLPHPGLTVAVATKKRPFAGEIKDINGDFLREVQVLVDCLLNPKHCVQKKINGKVITGSSLVNYAIACSRTFSSGRIPEPKTMLQTSRIVMLLQAINKCVEKYNSIMGEKCKDYLDDNPFKSIDREAQEEVLSLFEENAGFCDKEMRQSYLSNLISSLRIQHDIYLKRNYSKGRDILTQVREAADDLVKRYALEMEKVTKKVLISESKFMELHKRHTSDAKDSFVSQHSKNIGFDETFTILETDLNFAFEVLHRQHKETVALAEYKKKGAELKVQEVMHICLDLYRTEMSQFLAKYIEETALECQHTKTKEMATKHYTESTKGIRGSGVQLYMDKLVQQIVREYEEVKVNNGIKGKMLGLLLNQKKFKLIPVYLNLMSECMKDNYVIPEVLEAAHRKTVDTMVQSLVKDDIIKECCWEMENEPLVTKCITELRLDLSKMFEDIKELNKKNRSIYLRTTSGFRSFFYHLLSSKQTTTTHL